MTPCIFSVHNDSDTTDIMAGFLWCNGYFVQSFCYRNWLSHARCFCYTIFDFWRI